MGKFKQEAGKREADFSLVERHFTRNHSTFAEKFSAGNVKKAAIVELKLKAEQSKSLFFVYIIFFSLY